MAVISKVNLSKLISLPYKMWNGSHICRKIDTVIDAIQSSADVSSLTSALNLLKSNLCPRNNVPITLKMTAVYHL